jgi:APA family basic amino acid/polyamine antiporter
MAVNSAANPTTAPAPQRALGLTMCVALLVGNTIGVGIFMLPASLAPYGANAIPAWLITTVGCIFIAWVFAGFARSFPQDDGPYAYASRAFGRGVAFIIMWCYWVSTWVTNAVIVTGVVGYLTIFFPGLGTHRAAAALVSLGLLWLFVLVNAGGVRAAGWVQLLTTVLKLVPQLGVIALGLWAASGTQGAPVAHIPATPVSAGAVLAASTLALYAMLGVESAAMPAGRVRDPGRTIPRATFIGTLVVATIYMCVSLVPMLLLPQNELAASNAPFADLCARFLGPASGKIVAAFVIVSGLGCLNGWTLILGELTVSFARHGGFPQWFSGVNSRGAPIRAFVLTTILASVAMIMNYNDSMTSAFTLLSLMVTATNLPIYIGCALAVLILWRRGEIPHPGPRETRWIIAAFIAACYCVWVSIGIGTKPMLWSLVPCAAGIPVYAAYWWVTHARRQAVAAAST